MQVGKPRTPQAIDLPLPPGPRARKCERSHYAPQRSKIGEKSYRCKTGEHGFACTKLNCPCECHENERILR